MRGKTKLGVILYLQQVMQLQCSKGLATAHRQNQFRREITKLIPTAVIQERRYLNEI